MTLTYNIILDDGTPVFLSSISAAEAMQIAIDRHRGRKVAQCWTGDLLRNPQRGFTDFEIPNHTALPPKEPRPKRDPKESACLLFDDAQVLGASKEALWKAGKL